MPSTLSPKRWTPPDFSDFMEAANTAIPQGWAFGVAHRLVESFHARPAAVGFVERRLDVLALRLLSDAISSAQPNSAAEVRGGYAQILTNAKALRRLLDKDVHSPHVRALEDFARQHWPLHVRRPKQPEGFDIYFELSEIRWHLDQLISWTEGASKQRQKRGRNVSRPARADAIREMALIYRTVARRKPSPNGWSGQENAPFIEFVTQSINPLWHAFREHLGVNIAPIGVSELKRVLYAKSKLGTKKRPITAT